MISASAASRMARARRSPAANGWAGGASSTEGARIGCSAGMPMPSRSSSLTYRPATAWPSVLVWLKAASSSRAMVGSSSSGVSRAAVVSDESGSGAAVSGRGRVVSAIAWSVSGCSCADCGSSEGESAGCGSVSCGFADFGVLSGVSVPPVSGEVPVSGVFPSGSVAEVSVADGSTSPAPGKGLVRSGCSGFSSVSGVLGFLAVPPVEGAPILIRVPCAACGV